MLIRTTIMLPEALKNKAIKLARTRKISLGELIRYVLKQECIKKTNISDSFFDDTVFFEGEIPDNLSSRHDDYLYGYNKTEKK